VKALRINIPAPGSKGWDIEHQESMGHVHISPREDLMQHELTGDCCTCGPKVEYVPPCEDCETPGGYLITHRSLDGREALERSITIRFDQLAVGGLLVLSTLVAVWKRLRR
jgi:hypothetical protein